MVRAVEPVLDKLAVILQKVDGFIRDCRGCAYDVCHHFGEEGSCFYGGPIAEEVYPGAPLTATGWS